MTRMAVQDDGIRPKVNRLMRGIRRQLAWLAGDVENAAEHAQAVQNLLVAILTGKSRRRVVVPSRAPQGYSDELVEP
jgi:hypothetical protein